MFDQNTQNTIEKLYKEWCDHATQDFDVKKELQELKYCYEKREDAFYKDLTFGTGGLRGVIGAGTNRMNIYTVAKASLGVAMHVKRHYEPQRRSIAISYDSRIKSDVFAKVASEVFAANNNIVYIFPRLMPTPCLSYAVRQLHCAAGIMITASHNPAYYNGYKVYGEDGCQIGKKEADAIMNDMNYIDVFADIKRREFKEAMEQGQIRYVPEKILDAFIGEVKKQSMLSKEDRFDKNISIVYSPLNGTGLEPVLRVLKETGYGNITVVEEQEKPDGRFLTCPSPNPETEEAMALGITYARKCQAELLLATDPDCDRVGIAVQDPERIGEYVLLSGNETGVLLLDYICSRRIKKGTMPKNPCAIKTIVTTDMGEQIARHYGVEMIQVLTGFKYIGEQIGRLEEEGRLDSYIFGLEESYGYLTGSYVRDKDAVGASYLICEMFTYYKNRGISLLEQLNHLYEQFGFYQSGLLSFVFEGVLGIEKMSSIMNAFRNEILTVGEIRVVKKLDYAKGQEKLPKADVLKLYLEEDCSVVIRPSGTEPKIKVYMTAKAMTKEAAKEMLIKIDRNLKEIISQLSARYI